MDRRSVYRLLDIIQALGFPVYDDADGPGREKFWKQFMEAIGARSDLDPNQKEQALKLIEDMINQTAGA